MKIIRMCKCGKEFITYDCPSMKNKGIYCSKRCRIKYSVHPSGMKYNIRNNNKSWFNKGQKPWNKGMPTRESTRKLWSKIRSGKRNSIKTEFKSEDVSGSKNVNWNGGITPLVEQIRHCLKYRLWRSDVFTRDDFTCQECFTRGGVLHAHHIKKFSEIIKEYAIKTLEDALNCEELWNLNNGKTLCKKCHDEEERG